MGEFIDFYKFVHSSYSLKATHIKIHFTVTLTNHYSCSYKLLYDFSMEHLVFYLVCFFLTSKGLI